ncbi:Drug resistance protein [Penicillium citrinum]|uniref:Drug resistance protein n=1 Tax=Penicillium citrinum TaxID=5077 RepID=A0A9W9PGU1_PENCI|nr:Drug resistance protein [Penicillium citrinum]KAJ5242728.1 Drug resistance protein [Penicillium citrinum]
MIFALFGAVAPNSALLGAIFGALFSQIAWSPWTFWTQAIVSVVCAILGSIVVHSIHHDNPYEINSFIDLLKALDATGAACGIAGSFSSISPGIKHPLRDGAPLGMFHLSWVALPVVGAPLVPGSGITGALKWSSPRGAPLIASAEFIPVSPVGIAACFIAGILIARMRPGWIMMMLMTVFTLGNILTAIAPVDQTYWALTFVTLLVIPWGMDLSFPAATLMLSDSVERKHQGIAASLMTTVVNYSISLSLGFVRGNACQQWRDNT